MAVKLQELLPRDEPNPEEERHVGFLEVLRHPVGNLQKGVLDDIRSIDAPAELPLESEADHAVEPGAVAVEKGPQGLGFSPCRRPDHLDLCILRHLDWTSLDPALMRVEPLPGAF